MACTAAHIEHCKRQFCFNYLANTTKHLISLLIPLCKGCAKVQWCIKDEDDKSFPHLQQEIESQHHTYRKLCHPQETDSPPPFWGYSLLEPGTHTEKHLYYIALTPLHNPNLESESNHFFQKAPPAQKKALLVWLHRLSETDANC